MAVEGASAAPPLDGLGATAAVAEAVREAGPLLPLRDAEQLELMRDTRGALDVVKARRTERGRGRPKGARNSRTKQIRDYLLSRYAHPLEVLMQIATRPIDAIVAETGCKPIEALQLIKSAAAEAAPYLESKLVAIDLEAGHERLGMLVIAGVTHSEEEVQDILDGEFLDVDGGDGESEQDQSVSHPPAEPLE